MSPHNDLADVASPSQKSDVLSAAQVGDGAATPLRLRTQFAFALLTSFGGMLIGTGAETGELSVIVVFFAIVGFLCVDWLKLFSLPPLIAYVAMALTAVVCIVDFAQDSYVLAPKMAAVAQLLAVAQAILMLQEKSHRVFEQLLIFALLNCIVAAVYNDAFSYAIWFFPLTVTAAVALALLSADEAVTRAREFGRDDSGLPSQGILHYDNRAAAGSFYRVSFGLSWTSLILLLPAVTAIAAVIFFALPRRVEAQRGVAATAMVGYSDTVQLGEIGRMQMSQERALRVKLHDPVEEKPYAMTEGIYLRGRALEQYVSETRDQRGGGTWQNRSSMVSDQPEPLPARFIPSRESDFNFYGRVHVDVRCEAMRSSALFALAPFHRIIGSESVTQRPAQWTITRDLRKTGGDVTRFERIDYRFGTHGFHNGKQNRWVHDLSLEPLDRDLRSPNVPPTGYELTTRQHSYLNSLRHYPVDAVPTAGVLADEIVAQMSPSKRSPVEIATRLEQHLSQDPRYSYTLNLNAEMLPGVDPLEQFLSINRRGHCQYFASALAMMLRSQGIPARLVVGYHCSEFNKLGQYFVVRQSHAHAWVEALIDRDDIPLSENLYGQPSSRRYWLRLDPTPGGGGVPESDAVSVGSRRRIAELAQDFWNDFVIEMDPQRQSSSFQTTPGLTPVSNSYRTWIERIKRLALRLNSDDIQLPGRRRTLYALAAGAAVILGLMALSFLKRQFPEMFRRRRESESGQVARPSIAFYSEALELLEGAGYARSSGQTPAELTASLPDQRIRTPTAVLTQWFYRLRYGSGSARDPEVPAPNDQAIEQTLARLRHELQQATESATPATPDLSKE
ncbi:transglutaminase TgpA family protein [Allorhodopirellula solitaria]|uniref:Protein-glutamine gamma-glutamyltransferase n=1 Tax=Allorhodopirellula solitaria TaxID=2527987 RepID=A0A5C5YKQ4_9BACT|nr:transglutaminaseTgpA domain-containing protein [Allorhodopirellula solitaria]TWT75431.1 Protein-glutamine gamma-glutamyltransferase [Allorhodopirellula solitaria]